MAKIIFTTSESSAYDDLPEERYHFPSTYLGQAQQSIGDWAIYYEPRRTTGPSSSTGRQAYFAMARVDRIVLDPERPGHHYAFMKEYVEFDQAVPFRVGDRFLESGLRKGDGSVNKGKFGRSVRLLPDEEFSAIISIGFSRSLHPWEISHQVTESPVPAYVDRPLVTQVVTRKFRDEAFRRHVREAYGNACAITGLKLINGGGRPEVQAAHIRPVEENGPDTVRNGLALTGTIHWLFDRGLISIDESFRVLRTRHGLPDDLTRLLPVDGRLRLPESLSHRPHPTYLEWHRTNRFKG